LNLDDILRNPNDGNGVSFMFLMIGWIVLALVLFVMRPNSLRGSERGNRTKRSGPNDACVFHYSFFLNQINFFFFVL
jgi:hypothetical protein